MQTATQSEINQTEMSTVLQAIQTELARLPHRVADALDLPVGSSRLAALQGLKPTELLPLVAKLRTELTARLDELERLVQRYGALDRIEQHRRGE